MYCAGLLLVKGFELIRWEKNEDRGRTFTTFHFDRPEEARPIADAFFKGGMDDEMKVDVREYQDALKELKTIIHDK